jgi:hypothetical protein
MSTRKNGHLHWLCGSNDDSHALETDKGADEEYTANELTSSLPTSTHSDVISAQPIPRPAMVVQIVEKECEPERIRGGCCFKVSLRCCSCLTRC